MMVCPASAKDDKDITTEELETALFDPDYYFCMIADLPLDESVVFLKDYKIPVPRIFGEELSSAKDAADFVKATVENYREYRHCGPFNLTWANEFVEAICDAAEKHYFGNRTAGNSVGLRGLTDSTVYLWNDGCLNYNCYGYAMKNTNMLVNPGHNVSPSLENLFVSYLMNFDNNNLDEVMDIVETDIRAQNYDCVKQYTACPSTSGLASGETLICIRIGQYTGLNDYHFMRYIPSAGKWNHKPGKTAVLRFKYAPSYKNWSNECYDSNGYHTANLYYYTSSIGYFVYKTNHTNSITILNSAYHQYTCNPCGESHTEHHIENAAGTKCKICGQPTPFSRNAE